MLKQSSLPIAGKVQIVAGAFHFNTSRSSVDRRFPFSLPKFRLSKSRATILTEDTHDSHTHGNKLGFHGLHHVGLLCENLEESLRFYCDILGLPVNPDRPHKKLPYRGAWLWLGLEMIHLMELPNPDPKTGRPEYGGKDRHVCVVIEDLDKLEERLKTNGIQYVIRPSGRRAVLFRDPDANCLEVFGTEA